MSSKTNPATLTLKLERDSSPFTPRSPKNFPVQLDSDSENEDKTFLVELRKAEEEFGLAPPGLATPPRSAQAKTRKPRAIAKKKHNAEGDRLAEASPASEETLAGAHLNAEMKEQVMNEI
ncbi:hypothetical protein DFH06DRAFT_1146941 [Mycena polygramma]|nr:hypothetical protein DFH06DRAFT_1146941 [Mycena polygramma]